MLTVFGLLLLLYAMGRVGLHIGNAGVMFESHTNIARRTPYLGDGVMILLTIAIYWLSAALRSIAKGGLFTHDIVRQFRQFALWLLIMALFSFVAPWVIAAAAVGPGVSRHVVSLDIRDLLLIGITCLLFLLTRLLERAGEIEQENREIV